MCCILNLSRTPATHFSHIPHDSVFLSVNEALQHDSDGHVHIVAVDVLPQVHSGMGLSNTNDGLDMPYCDGYATSPLGDAMCEP